MTLAANELKKSSMSTGAVADAVGYQSEAAFQSAFKQRMGVTPAQWRRTASAAMRDAPEPSSTEAYGGPLHDYLKPDVMIADHYVTLSDAAADLAKFDF